MIKLRKKEEKQKKRKGERTEGRKEKKEGMERRMEGGRKEGKREIREDGRGSGLCWYSIILCEGGRQVLCQWLPWSSL